ncbi:hypothetical protein [Streptomyces sp. AC495_CC817]|uniref:hypothetical protein n=1 Tax=Streptomyces sp. AC495_CC817 TaxID=2823900 RepID=UPI001C2743CC|nr:hypothetical protein [Streptomyces sp. AC495_CC817]
MWDYDAFIGKSQLYFSRAENYPDAEDEASALWLLLGLEFLLRAPLARIHPTLLADVQSGGGDAIMQAAGYPLKVDGGPPKSIATKTVITRLGAVIPEFKERQDDATLLTGLRNEELHSSESPLALDDEMWLPHFTRVVEVICKHLELNPAEIVGDEIMRHGRSLVDAADKKLDYEIRKRIEGAKAFFDRLKPEEVAARKKTAKIPTYPFSQPGSGALVERTTEPIACPACQESVPLVLGAVRTTNEGLEDDEIYRDVIYVAFELSCPVCELRLNGTPEIRSAGIKQQYVRRERESLAERYISTYEPEYGND